VLRRYINEAPLFAELFTTLSGLNLYRSKELISVFKKEEKIK